MSTISVSSVQPEGVLGFFKSLATDDDFRALVEKDTKTGLEKFGISIEGLPDTVTLPSKDKIQEALKAAGVSGEGDPTIAVVHIAFLAFFAFMQ